MYLHNQGESKMKIVTDTASLFSPLDTSILNLSVVPACVIYGDKVYKDYEEISSEEFLELAESGAIATTSQPAIGDLIEVFENTKEETLALLIGDGLSGGYQNAVGAKNSIDENDHIRIIDTKTLAGAEHYLVQKAIRLRDEGLSIDEIEQEILKNVETSASFVIPADFEFLKRSGRLTPLAAKIGTMIKIVPVMTQTEDKKKITLFTIKRSWKKAAEAVLEHLQKMGINEEYMIYICHAGNQKAAEAVAAQTKEAFPEVDIEIMFLSPSMMTHGGPGCVTIQTIRK